MEIYWTSLNQISNKGVVKYLQTCQFLSIPTFNLANSSIHLNPLAVPGNNIYFSIHYVKISIQYHDVLHIIEMLHARKNISKNKSLAAATATGHLDNYPDELPLPRIPSVAVINVQTDTEAGLILLQ